MSMSNSNSNSNRLLPTGLLRLFVFLLLLLGPPSSSFASAKPAETHYTALEVEPSCTLKDVKKAYRRLAVQHHPDRNRGNEEAATVKFRALSEAYEVLSDADLRRDYDRALKYGGSGGGGGHSGFGFGGRDRRGRDPFEQFDNVFKTDPFFAEAFKGMDDLFDQHFAGAGGGAGRGGGGGGGGMGGMAGMMGDMMGNMMGGSFNIKMESSTSMGGRTTQTTKNFGGGSYTSKSTRTAIENGRRVTVQSMEKDGNRIEERYVGEELIERKINGEQEDIGRIAGGEF